MPILADHVLFIDAEAIVIDKPAGLPVTSVRDGSFSVENYLASLCFGFKRWPMIVHRLDRDTSGCLLLARNPRIHRRFSEAFSQGLVKKCYWAILSGIPDKESGIIDLPLTKISSVQKGWQIIADPKGKRAVTRWHLLARIGAYSLVEFQPETGRTHQLRVHAATGLGLPILGDPFYGTDKSQKSERMMLHARSLMVPRENKKPVAAVAPIPKAFKLLGVKDKNYRENSEA
ncbi:MAG: RNA pseudouridine synthase [Zymomonas mobilis subsp. pomaceae]|uniref:Pseudouridine synthase n=1 Tax=Zymomonas mobilis subsp. pomaceae (strain ATCC 29192 / DSM 22645 / JCM 10191 / CCUG 17912 / NBRC 13757 / NCIMB 11200 / NRRL B-4491 / Barker I) TaxID=579138 RepID=F8ES40_ZYMMT|nr:pseudouridine synthase [Zymomonas mobilis]AEI37615.1 pseudouridine synthase [Zymomonas mobilis subsp. pomaceae ATCC 29192]MDX5948983.1 RNA pseudouridine synthase [Zymomonas mobilis subsp. pomaceae]GEB88788.1 RNA pseudouridine synthase [Zymomonas mobilis subsp. pomaceae]